MTICHNASCTRSWVGDTNVSCHQYCVYAWWYCLICRGAFATAVAERTHSNFFSETYFRSMTRHWKIDNALLPASIPRHLPLAVSLFTGTTMKESDNLSLCLLPFHDTRPLFVLTLLAGTAIKETERWVETLAVLRTHSLQLSAYYHHVLEYVCSLTYLLNHLRPLCVMVLYHFGEKWRVTRYVRTFCGCTVSAVTACSPPIACPRHSLYIQWVQTLLTISLKGERGNEIRI